VSVAGQGCCVPWALGALGWGGVPWAAWDEREGSWGRERQEKAREPRKSCLPGLRGFAPAPSPRGERAERGQGHPSSEHPPTGGHRAGRGQPRGRPPAHHKAALPGCCPLPHPRAKGSQHSPAPKPPTPAPASNGTVLAPFPVSTHHPPPTHARLLGVRGEAEQLTGVQGDGAPPQGCPQAFV